MNTEIYVVMWEHWDGCEIAGGDLYMSLDENKANAFRDEYARKDYDDLVWDGENEIWIYQNDTEIHKVYTVFRPLDEEL